MPTEQTRQKDVPGIPHGKGTGGSWAAFEPDADQIDLSADRLVDDPDAVLEALHTATSAANRRLDIASGKVLANEIRKFLPDAQYLVIAPSARREGRFVDYAPLSVDKPGGEPIAVFNDNDVLYAHGNEIGTTSALKEALRHIQQLPPFLTDRNDEGLETVHDPDYRWLTAGQNGNWTVALDDVLSADLP